MVDRRAPVPRDVEAHLSSCLRCQAELARYRHLARSLHALRNERIRPAPESVAATVGAIAEAPTPRWIWHTAQMVYLGGAVAAAAAASAAGMVLWATRRRAALLS
jgi:anti-sigma factor RsiW